MTPEVMKVLPFPPGPVATVLVLRTRTTDRQLDQEGQSRPKGSVSV